MKKNKVILITGISSGVGKAFVEESLKKKNLIIVGLGRNNLLNVDNNRYFFYKMDLRKPRTISKAIKEIFFKFKTIDVLINNAGLGYRGTIEDMTMEEIRDQFEVNFFGLIYIIKLILPIMRRQKYGHVVNISTVGAIVNTPTLGIYGASKISVDKISEILSQEVKNFNIKVSCLIPGAIKTNFGKNIIEAKNINNRFYLSLYNEWRSRFRWYFKKFNSSEEVAKKLIQIIERPQNKVYMNVKDALMCYLSKLFPTLVFDKYFLNFFYKYEN